MRLLSKNVRDTKTVKPAMLVEGVGRPEGADRLIESTQAIGVRYETIHGGLDSIGAERRARLMARYSGFEHPAAAEDGLRVLSRRRRLARRRGDHRRDGPAAGSEGRRIAALAKKAIEDEWQKIADSVHEDICSKLSTEVQERFQDWDNVWDSQMKRFPVVDFVIHEWQAGADQLAAQNTPPLNDGWKNHPLHHAEQWKEIVEQLGESRHVGTNFGSHWALHYATTDWKFAAAKSARDFASWQSPTNSAGQSVGSAKDHLNGRDEVIGGSNNDAFWDALRSAYGSEFKSQQRYGAISVIKRLWARTCQEMENGTYHRDVFKARLHAKQREERKDDVKHGRRGEKRRSRLRRSHPRRARGVSQA